MKTSGEPFFCENRVNRKYLEVACPISIACGCVAARNGIDLQSSLSEKSYTNQPGKIFFSKIKEEEVLAVATIIDEQFGWKKPAGI